MKHIFSKIQGLAPFLFLLSLFFSATNVCAQQMRVAFINPTSPGEPFWQIVTNFMRSAADDLDIQLDVYYSGGNRFRSLEIVKDILQTEHRPHYLIFNFQAQTGALILDLAEEAKVHSFSINTDVPEQEKEQIGIPRSKFTYWLGHMSPDDFHAGYTLIQALVSRADVLGQKAQDGKIHVVGLTGTSDNTASFNRNRGLEEFVSTRDDVVLHQIVNAVWDRKKAHDITQVLFQRYPNISILWAASDLMSLGAIEAAKLNNKRINVDIFSGGIDGTQEALNSIIEGEMYVSMTGHFMEGGWALVLLNDHYHSIDFAPELGETIYSRMELISSTNAQKHLAKYEKNFFDQVDFKQFSKAMNPKLKSYHFQIPASIYK